jgi:iron complex transport system ATP-binding protein
MTAEPWILEARNLGFAYRHPVVRAVSLRLARGEVTGIIGPNGSGKTTVLRLLDGILRPTEGDVLLFNVPLTGMPRKEIARHVAMVPQNGSVHYYQTVFQFAMLGRSPHLSLLGFESSNDEKIVRDALSVTHLLDYRARRVAELSGGEKQRLLLARALSQQSEVLLLDEFTANLDVNYQVALMRLVRRITRERDLATLVVSHEINLLAAFSDRIVLISHGTVLQQGTVRETITGQNLRQLFGLDFRIHLLQDGTPEILPVMKEGDLP